MYYSISFAVCVFNIGIVVFRFLSFDLVNPRYSVDSCFSIHEAHDAESTNKQAYESIRLHSIVNLAEPRFH